MRYFLLISLVFLLFAQGIGAQTLNTSNTAQVGNHNLSISGFIAPFASVVLTTGSTFLASTVADENGNFSFTNVLVNQGLESYCLEAIDVKKIGSSYTCFDIDPIIGDTGYSDIFLPPTLGLSGTILNPGSTIIASGYSMPGARVILNIGNGIIIDTIADENGFWSVEIKDLAAGKYQLFATANYQEDISEKPDRTTELEAISLVQKLKDNSKVILAILLLIILAITIAILLRSKRIRNRLGPLIGKKHGGAVEGERHLHHEWFVGY